MSIGLSEIFSVVVIIVIIRYFLQKTKQLEKEIVKLDDELYRTKNERYKYYEKECRQNEQISALRIHIERLERENLKTDISQEDIKSIINMIHPDKQPDSRKKRAAELFQKLRSLQK